MSEQQQGQSAGQSPEGAGGAGGGEQVVVVVGPDGQPIGTIPADQARAMAAAARGQAGGEGGGDADDDERHITELVEQPAKVMRIGGMIRQLLEEVKAAPLDEASRQRLRDIHAASITELEAGLAPELVEELQRLSLPFTEDSTPSEGELRIAQAQLVGWLEGLFHGLQTAIYAQQMAAGPVRADASRAARGPGRSGRAAAGRRARSDPRRLGRHVPLTDPPHPQEAPGMPTVHPCGVSGG